MVGSYSYSNSNSSISGDISSWSHLSSLSTDMTFTPEETPEESRTRRKKLIKSIIDEDDYLLQEIVTELRQEKIEKIKNAKI